jgi:hypothetical protein
MMEYVTSDHVFALVMSDLDEERGRRLMDRSTGSRRAEVDLKVHAAAYALDLLGLVMRENGIVFASTRG